MSRVASNPITVPASVEVNINGQHVAVKGPKGAQEFTLHKSVEIIKADNVLTFKERAEVLNTRRHSGESRNSANALAGTSRSLVNNMVIGVVDGFEKKLTLVGVGYRSKVQGKNLDLTLGFSHPVVHELPDGVTAETPSQTEIIIRGIDKQKVGQTAAEIRAYRPPEPYKGKGVKYADEHIVRKEAKKK